MPYDPSLRSILVVGAGPIVIGQACEFDYSGVQACKALKEEGCRVILLNSNPATVMTDPLFADALYLEPHTLDMVEEILAKEKPDALLATLGGQTSLNLARKLSSLGLLDKYQTRLLGLNLKTLEQAEDRKLFRKVLHTLGLSTPSSYVISSLKDLAQLREKLSFPLIVRCSFTLGGQGGGVAYDSGTLETLCRQSLTISPEILLEESLIGWKEFELELLRDEEGNCIVVAGLENIDPMGIHTGDSLSVCPIQTLSDKEYQAMRQEAFRIITALDIRGGGCNIQFALDPKTRRRVCIEVNPRVSRSSALASKATGFPIARISTKIALGYRLNEVFYGSKAFRLPASFEPVMDYVVTKIPYFAFDRFPQINDTLSISMQSVGEVMAVGRTFKESLQKALSSLEAPPYLAPDDDKIKERLKTPHPRRLELVLEAFKRGFSLEELEYLTQYDPWFLKQLQDLVEEKKELSRKTLAALPKTKLREAKQKGFSDALLATLLNCKEEDVLKKREEYNLVPVYKRIDTCSAEFPSDIPCFYSSYEEECEVPSSCKEKIVILGSGANRIGQGIEFDYCCVHAILAVQSLGYEAILINCNPATVSTDYDLADRLYLEPIGAEYVLSILQREKPTGILTQVGGQTPLLVAKHPSCREIPLLGTPFVFIDLAEDRAKFRSLVASLGLPQPKTLLCSFDTLHDAACEIGFPLIVRPSYIIGGSHLKLFSRKEELSSLPSSTYLLEEYLEGAKEIEVDALCDGEEIFICGIIEHIDPVGVHSGDSLSFLSPHSLDEETEHLLIEQTKTLGHALNIRGFFNVQFALTQHSCLVIELNPRASRTLPLLAKVTGLPLIRMGIYCLFGHHLKELGWQERARPKWCALKIPIFPFRSLSIPDPNRGLSMQSTGEVLCLGKSWEEVAAKAKMYALLYPDINLEALSLDISPFPQPLCLND